MSNEEERKRGGGGVVTVTGCKTKLQYIKKKGQYKFLSLRSANFAELLLVSRPGHSILTHSFL